MTGAIRVLMADADPARADALTSILEGAGEASFIVERTTRLADAVEALRTTRFDAVVADLMLRDSKGLPTLAILLTYADTAPVLVLSDTAEDPVSLRALQQGAYEQIPRDQLYETPVVRSIRYAVERSRTERALRESEQRYRTLFQNARDAIYLTDGEGRIQEVNRAALELFEYPAEELVGRDVRCLFAQEVDYDRLVMELDRGRPVREFEVRMRARSGRDVWCLLAVTPRLGPNERVVGSLGILHDITERKQTEMQLQHDALHDGLTGLPNRALFLDRLERAVRRADREEEPPFAVLFLDLDRFKSVNDALGHAAGDRVLRRTAGLLRACVRDGDTVARIGGDEFAVLLEGLQTSTEAIQVAERMLRLLDRPYRLADREFFTTASIGICRPTREKAEADALLRDADRAMYRAKSQGGGRYQLFDQEMHRAAVSQLEVESDLRKALDRGELVLVYQPILSCRTGRTTGFEALARWNHPRRGRLEPASFISLAEETALILPLGRWALREAAAQLRSWRDSGVASDDLIMSVNLSPRQFIEPDLVDQVATILSEEGVPPRAMVLELTETALMQNPEQAAARMGALRRLGVGLCMDDFGTGYSSLAHLRRFPLDTLKVDRSFVHRLDSRRDFELTAAITGLARTLGIHAVIEGVETPEQLLRVRRLRPRAVQGFLFSRPVDPESAAAFLRDQHAAFRGSAAATLRSLFTRVRERLQGTPT